MNELIKLLPSVDSLLTGTPVQPLLQEYKREWVRDVCRDVLENARQRLSNDEQLAASTKEEMAQLVSDLVIQNIEKRFSPRLKAVINATGVILHTGLGRAPLSKAAQENVKRVMQGYSNLELDMQTGKRGERTDHIRALLCQLTGSEDALLVNNNAAAVFLALNTLAFGKEAIISRGQLVEIGGSFRMPDVIEKSGVLMREVGTTNKTKLSDYQNAINENTGVIVVAHTSNYKVLGFTQDVELNELCQLAHAYNIPVLHDLGAGVIVDLQDIGLPYEPTVQESLRAGADVITFSGDKVLGGPQSGLIVGSSEWLQRIHKNPLMRAVRCDKLIYAAMEATLKLYLRNDLLRQHTVMRMLTEPIELIKQRAQFIMDQLNAEHVRIYDINIKQSAGQFGSGALPLESIDSFAIVLKPPMLSADELMKLLRSGEPPIVGYIQDDCVWLDMRTLGDDHVSDVIQALNGLPV